MSDIPTAFVSYSWDSDEHRLWVKELSSRLRSDGIEVTLDQWHAIPGDLLPDFMAASIDRSDYVLIICTPGYKEKSKRKAGGVKYEGDIITGELFVRQNQRKYITILRSGDWEEAAPLWFLGKHYIDLRVSEYYERGYSELLSTLRGDREQAPPVGTLDLRERQFRQDLRKPDYLDSIEPQGIGTDLIRDFILDSTNEAGMRIRALELYCKWGFANDGFLELSQMDDSQDFREALALYVGKYKVTVSAVVFAKLLSDEALSVRKAAIEAAYALISAGRFTSALLQDASVHKSWESRYAAVRRIIEIDDDDSVKTLMHFKGTDYHRTRDRIREYFEALFQEGRLQGENLASAVAVLSKFESDGRSSVALAKRMRRALDMIQNRKDKDDVE